MAKRDLMDYLAAAKPEAKEEEDEAPAEKPDLASKRLLYLAEEAGVSNPAALVKLVKACCKQYMGEPAAETEGPAGSEEG